MTIETTAKTAIRNLNVKSVVTSKGFFVFTNYVSVIMVINECNC